jgi:hypothetical protein
VKGGEVGERGGGGNEDAFGVDDVCFFALFYSELVAGCGAFGGLNGAGEEDVRPEEGEGARV